MQGPYTGDRAADTGRCLVVHALPVRHFRGLPDRGRPPAWEALDAATTVAGSSSDLCTNCSSSSVAQLYEACNSWDLLSNITSDSLLLTCCCLSVNPQDRNMNHSEGGPEASRMTAAARRKLGTLGTSLDQLFRWLDSADAASL